MGTYVNCDEAAMVGGDRSINFQVNADVSKPWRRHIFVKVEGNLSR